MSLLSSLTIFGSIDQVPAVWEMTHSLSAILALTLARPPLGNFDPQRCCTKKNLPSGFIIAMGPIGETNIHCLEGSERA